MRTETSERRILHVFGTLDRGGADTSIMTLYRNIDRSRLQFDFVVHGAREGVLEDEVRQLGGRILRVPRLTPASMLSYVAAWVGLLKQHPEYEVVHGHYFTISGLYLGLAKLHGRRVVAHAHNTMPGLSGLLVSIFNWWLRWGSDLRLACSRSAAEFLYGKSAVRRDRVVVLRNPIDVDRFAYNHKIRSDVRCRLGLRRRLVVGHVGRFNVQKNHHFLLEVFKELVRRNPSAVLLLVGDGPIRAEVERRVESLGLASSVIFAGATRDVADLLQAMDVFVLPSLFEGFGVVAIEAQAAGLPTIVSDVVPPEALPTPLATVRMLEQSPGEWADAILACARQGERRSYAAEIRLAGFDGPECAAHLTALYSDLDASAFSRRAKSGP